jgi:hypothetical protein
MYIYIYHNFKEIVTTRKLKQISVLFLFILCSRNKLIYTLHEHMYDFNFSLYFIVYIVQVVFYYII